MRGAGGLGDVASGAEAFIKKASGAQLAKGVGIETGPPGLPHDLSVPGEADGGEVGKLEFLGAGTCTVEVLDAHEEPA